MLTFINNFHIAMHAYQNHLASKKKNILKRQFGEITFAEAYTSMRI